MEHLDILVPIGVMVALLVTLLVWEPVQRWKFKREIELRDRMMRRRNKSRPR